ncbi:hypothetical protein CHU98_g3945 [Xylaria longipes]|nr:hypothetical protein CHU98_g3945 [Xylaria longipes]
MKLQAAKTFSGEILSEREVRIQLGPGKSREAKKARGLEREKRIASATERLQAEDLSISFVEAGVKAEVLVEAEIKAEKEAKHHPPTESERKGQEPKKQHYARIRAETPTMPCKEILNLAQKAATAELRATEAAARTAKEEPLKAEKDNDEGAETKDD